MKNVILCFTIHHTEFNTYEDRWMVFPAEVFDNPLKAAQKHVVDMKKHLFSGNVLYSWNICTVEMSNLSHPEL